MVPGRPLRWMATQAGNACRTEPRLQADSPLTRLAVSCVRGPKTAFGLRSLALQARKSSSDTTAMDPVEAQRKQAVRTMTRGAIVFAIALATTIGTYSAASPGGTFIIGWGPIIFGPIRFFRGLVAYSRASSQLAASSPNPVQFGQPYGATSFTSAQFASQPALRQSANFLSPETKQPADWYPDPAKRHQYRYWDGWNWTGHVSNNGVVTQDPISA
jgi:hypothetical protein